MDVVGGCLLQRSPRLRCCGQCNCRQPLLQPCRLQQQHERCDESSSSFSSMGMNQLNGMLRLLNLRTFALPRGCICEIHARTRPRASDKEVVCTEEQTGCSSVHPPQREMFFLFFFLFATVSARSTSVLIRRRDVSATAVAWQVAWLNI